MAWRGLHISQPSRLSLGAKRLVVEQEEKEPLSFPLEDVAWVVLDTPQVTLTAALMAGCMEAGIPIICSDARHHPCGLLLPFHQHWQQAGVARQQMTAAAPLKKRLWQAIVRRKIENQAATTIAAPIPSVVLRLDRRTAIGRAARWTKGSSVASCRHTTWCDHGKQAGALLALRQVPQGPPVKP